jgi:hypothetical protein
MSFWKSKPEPILFKPGPWDMITTPQPNQYSTPLDMRKIRSTMIDEFLHSKTFSSGIFIGDRIESNKENTVRKSMGVKREDIIKVIIDGTYWGSSENGFAISSDGLYWKEFWGHPQFANWEALSNSFLNKRMFFSSSETRIDNATIKMRFGNSSPKDLEFILTGVLNYFHSTFKNPNI